MLSKLTCDLLKRLTAPHQKRDRYPFILEDRDPYRTKIGHAAYRTVQILVRHRDSYRTSFGTAPILAVRPAALNHKRITSPILLRYGSRSNTNGSVRFAILTVRLKNGTVFAGKRKKTENGTVRARYGTLRTRYDTDTVRYGHGTGTVRTRYGHGTETVRYGQGTVRTGYGTDRVRYGQGSGDKFGRTIVNVDIKIVF